MLDPTCRFSFGIEIEVIAEPRELFMPAWTASHYYERLAECLRKRDLNAVADPLCDGHRKHPEHYDKWFITKDASLGRPSYPLRKLIPQTLIILSCIKVLCPIFIP
jgi:hypothetical protein